MLFGGTVSIMNGRKEMTSCFNISLCVVGDLYVDMAKTLLDNIRTLNNTRIYLLTNNRAAFKHIDNIVIIDFNKAKFSYHDQLIVAKQALEENDCTLLIDADFAFEKDTILDVSCDDFDCGCYPEWCFDDKVECSMVSFLKGKNKQVPYGKEFKEFCREKGYDVDGVKHFQESFLLIKETDEKKKERLFEAWEILSEFCNKKDEDRGRKVLGQGEGYSLSVALRYAGIEIQNNKKYRNLLKGFKHLRYEKNNKGKV